jgi:hypothetical protein
LPPIPSRYLDSVVYLYPSEGAAKAGDGAGGSGFLAGVPIGWEAGPMDIHFPVHALYVVTNAHVVEQGATHARLMGHDGTPRIVAAPTDSWRLHPNGDDVAVFPLDATNQEFACIPWNDFVPETNAVLPGDDVFFLGRYINVEGKQYNAPIARFGHVAMLATEEITTPRGNQLSYLVEALSLSGYSGSPVLAFRLHIENHFGGGISVSLGEPVQSNFITAGNPGRPSLLGIDWGHFHDPQLVLDSVGEPLAGRQFVKQNSGIAGVVPAWRLTELLQSEELTELRDEKRAEAS